MKVVFENLVISSEYLGNKQWTGGGMLDNWNNHRITVKNTETKKRCTFEFWASNMHPEIVTETQLLEAFECFVSDARCGEMYFEDFCAELGYDENSRRSEKVHNACIKHLTKYIRVIGEDLGDFNNRLRDYIDNLNE